MTGDFVRLNMTVQGEGIKVSTFHLRTRVKVSVSCRGVRGAIRKRVRE